MTFDEKYQNMPVGSIVLFEGDEYLKVARKHLCWNCLRLTYWVSTLFQAHLCSEQCATEKWNEYAEASRKGIPDEPKE